MFTLLIIFTSTFFEMVPFLVFIIICLFDVACFVTGQRLHRKYNSKFLMSIGLLAGMMHSYLGSMQRFMGLEPNAAEVAKFGVMSAEEVKRFNDRSWQGGAVDLIDTYTKGK